MMGDRASERDDEVLLRGAGPAHVDGSSMGIELDDLTLDVLLVRISRSNFMTIFLTFWDCRMSNCPRILLVGVFFVASS